MEPLFSVVTINRNNADGLKATLESVFSQDFDDYESIVVDACSTDTSVKVLEDMDSLIRLWVSEPDRGIYDGMNKGVALSTGRYIVFMNSGDQFHSNDTLKKVSSALKHTNTDLAFGKAYALESRKLYHYNEKLWQGMICSHQATFARRSLLERFPFSLDFRIVADYNFYVQCDLAGVKITPMEVDVALIDTSGISFSNFAARTEERMRICSEAYPRPDVYRHFQAILNKNGVPMPAWAATERDWMNGKA